MKPLDFASVAGLPFSVFASRVWPAYGMSSRGKMDKAVEEGGYALFDSQKFEPEVAKKGWTRCKIHLPFSDDSPLSVGEPMNEDARVEKTEPKSLDFEDMVERYPDLTFIAYLGSGWDPDFGRRLLANNFTGFTTRKLRSLGRLINLPNVDIAYDHSATFRAGYTKPDFPPTAWRVLWAWLAYVDELKGLQGRRVWMESVPSRNAPHQHRMPFICSTFKHPQRENTLQAEWFRSRPGDDAHYPAQSGNADVAPSQLLTGDALDWNRAFGRYESLPAYAASIAEVLARGPQWHWAGAIQLRPESARLVWEAVTEHASREATKASTDPDSPRILLP